MRLKPPGHLAHRVIRSSSPMEKAKKKRKPFLPATKKNFKKFVKHKISPPLVRAASIFKNLPDVK